MSDKDGARILSLFYERDYQRLTKPGPDSTKERRDRATEGVRQVRCVSEGEVQTANHRIGGCAMGRHL